MRNRKHGHAITSAVSITASIATGMPSHGVSPKSFHSSAVVYAPIPMNPPWPSETRPNRPITDQEVYMNDQISTIDHQMQRIGLVVHERQRHQRDAHEPWQRPVHVRLAVQARGSALHPPGGFAPWTPTKGVALRTRFVWCWEGACRDAANSRAGPLPTPNRMDSKGCAFGGDPRGRAPWRGAGAEPLACTASAHERRAIRPCGRANIMAMKKPKANT